MTSSQFVARVKSRQARVGIVGQGYVGLPLALVFGEAGFPVIGLRPRPRRRSTRSTAASPTSSTSAPSGWPTAVKSGRFRATTDFDELARLRRHPHLRAHAARPAPRAGPLVRPQQHAGEIAKRLRTGQLVVLESTTYPGTTDEDVPAHPRGDAASKTPADFFLAFSPEREDPGNPDFHTQHDPQGGGRRERGVHRGRPWRSTRPAIDTVVPVSSSRVAESSKLLENIFRSVNIALVNELKMTFDRMGIDIWEVIEAAKTKPFGFMPFYPGPGPRRALHPARPVLPVLEGRRVRHVDPLHRAGRRDQHAHAALRGGEDGRGAERGRQGHQGREGAGARASPTRPDIDDDRESPSYEIIELLQEAGRDGRLLRPVSSRRPATAASTTWR